MSKVSPKLRLVKANFKPRLGGLPPPDDMAPGKYVAKINRTVLGYDFTVTWQWTIHKGKFAGISLRSWHPMADKCGEVQPFGKFAKYCEIALRRPLGLMMTSSLPARFLTARSLLSLSVIAKANVLAAVARPPMSWR